MTCDDMNAVLEQVPGIVASSPMLEFHDNVSHRRRRHQGNDVAWRLSAVPDVRNLVVVSGRFFDDQDDRAHDKVAVIVEPFAEELYGTLNAAVGRTISVKGIPFIIIGVFQRSASTPTGSRRSATRPCWCLIPWLRYFTGTNTLKEIFFTMRDSAHGGAGQRSHSRDHPVTPLRGLRLQRSDAH